MEMFEGHQALAAPEGVPVFDVDPYDPKILCDPVDYYAQLRSLGPFVYIPRYQALACGRYEETRVVFSDWQRFVSSRGVGLQDFKHGDPWRPPSIVLEVDPPFHKKTRTVLTRALSPRAVVSLKERFRLAADKLIDELLDKGEFEGVSELAETFPTRVFPKAVGLKQSDRRKLVDYGAMVFNALGPDNDIRRDAMAMGPEIVPWITEQCRRENLDEDGFGAAIYAAADDGELSYDEAGMLVRSLLSAGVDTTVTAFGSAMWCFASFPGEYQRIRDDPKLIRPAFEEVLRYTSPVHTFCRTANLDTEVAGTQISDGAKILCVLGAANLDEAQWPQATRFDVRRKPVGHLALGVGIHQCVGQNVARAEAEALFSALAKKVSKIELNGQAVWRPNNSIHALDKLPIRFVPA
ncbi:MAG: cytochrome P450 [Burkholderiaceae bacterium]